METKTFYLRLFILASLSIQVSVLSFSVDLIHRDSPQSPFYNPIATKRERLTNAFHRSISRAGRISKSKTSPQDIRSQIGSANGEYLMKLTIGTPPISVFGVADTGSDLTWVQCLPCTKCFPQNSRIFDPRNSSTFRKLSCRSRRCQSDFSTCDHANNRCKYKLHYGDGSFSKGNIAAETLTFGTTSGRTVSIPKVVFGCGYKNGGTFFEGDSGIIGLGSSKVSIVDQLSSFTDRKFSYCLVPFGTNPNVTSKISFGTSADVSGSGVVSTPLLSNTYYFLALESISVGHKVLPFKHNLPKANARSAVNPHGDFNIIIDSGTTLTLIPRPFYQDIESELKKVIVREPTSDPDKIFSLCYSRKDDIRVPKIKAKFVGAELDLPETSTFVQISKELVCLAIVPTDDLPILGNIFQQNFLVGYDLEKSKISFKPTDCTKHL